MKLQHLHQPIVLDHIMIMITMDHHLILLDTVIVIMHQILGMYYNVYNIL